MNAIKCFVYIDYKPDGTPFYVGKGNRRRVHQNGRSKWHESICKKYPTWYREVVFSGEEKDCFALEVALIGFYGRKDCDRGPLVNLTDGGEGMSGNKPTTETREKISAAHKGKKLSEEHKRILSEQKIGVPRSPQQVERIRAFRHTEETKNKLKGRVKSEEEIAKIRAGNTGKVISAETRAKQSMSQLERLEQASARDKQLAQLAAARQKRWG